jgi:hypothetical protein
MTRELTKKEKNLILSKIQDKGISNDIERVLEVVKVPENADLDSIKEIRKRINDLLKKDLPRKLTEKELDDIVAGIPVSPCPIKKIALFNTQLIREKIRKQLSKQKYLVKEGTIDMIKNIIREAYLRALVQPGASVGSTGGMAMSSQITQAMLDAIHSSGTQTTKEESFEMIRSLIEIKKEPDILNYTVHFKDKNLVAEEISMIGDMLKGISIEDFVISKEILTELPEDDWRYYRNHSLIYGEDESINPEDVGNRFLRLTIDINKCFIYNTGIQELVEVIQNNTEDDDFDNTVICISSPLDRGFIDIHGNLSYIEYSVSTFSNLGKRIGDCSSIKKGKEEERLDQEDVKKEINDMELDEMTGIFLKVILSDCLSEMKVKGVSGIMDVIPEPAVFMDSTFKQTKVRSEIEIDKFSNSPYDLKSSEISRLWNIKITKSSIYFDGITFGKIRESFEICGMKIIEDSLETEHSMTIMMPLDRNEKFFDDDNDVRNMYQRKDTIWYNIEDQSNPREVNDQNYKPKMRMNSLRKFEQKSLSLKVINLGKDSNHEFHSVLPEFSKLYRATIYNYATISGKDITQDLFSNKLIDHRFLFPENTRAVKRIFGIESARFYLIWKYIKVNFIEKINPITVILLVNLQTSFDTLIPIHSTNIYKRGDSVLSELSFEKQNTIIKNSSAFGEEDNTSSVGSRIITGKPCLNGTGSVEVNYDPLYLNDPDNRYLLDVNQEGEIETLHTDDVLGGCLNSGVYVFPKDDVNAERADNPLLLSDSNKKPVVCNKEDVPSPPRTRAPESLRKKSTRRTTIAKGDRINIDNLEDIPEAPEWLDDDDFLDSL